VTSQHSLFGDVPEPDSTPVVSPLAAAGIAEWQVDMIRAALDKRGVAGMSDRQELIESIVGHAVMNLRELNSTEARQVLEGLSTTSPGRQASSWDDREEDTWIDRL